VNGTRTDVRFRSSWRYKDDGGVIRNATEPPLALREHDLDVYAVVLVKTDTICKTSSGKIQRHACRAAFLADELSAVGTWSLARGDVVAPTARSIPSIPLGAAGGRETITGRGSTSS
jgi:hypothetical protein